MLICLNCLWLKCADTFMHTDRWQTGRCSTARNCTQWLPSFTFHTLAHVNLHNNNNNTVYSHRQHSNQARCSSPEQDWQVFQTGQYSHLLPICREDSWYMTRHGHWADTRNWQAHHNHHRGHQGNKIPFPTPIHSSPNGKYGLLPSHYSHRVKASLQPFFICLTSIFTPSALCW